MRQRVSFRLARLPDTEQNNSYFLGPVRRPYCLGFPGGAGLSK